MTEVLTYERFYDRADPEAVFRLALPAAPTCGFLLDAREALIEYVDSLTADWQERGLSPADLAGNLRAATERLIEISLLLPDAPEDEDEPDGQDADTDAAPHRLGTLGEDRAFDLALHSGALLQEAINPFLASSALSGTEKVYFMLTLAEDALRMASSISGGVERYGFDAKTRAALEYARGAIEAIEATRRAQAAAVESAERAFKEDERGFGAWEPSPAA